MGWLARLSGLVLCLACLPAAWAQPVSTDEAEAAKAQAERTRIAAERGRAEAAYSARARQCYQQFAVNDCLQQARAERRNVLSDLHRQEVLLNDADRKKKGAKQLGNIEEKASLERQQDAAERRQKSLDSQRSREDSAQQRAADREEARRREPDKREQQQRSEQRQAESAASRASQAARAPTEAERYRNRIEDAARHKAEREKKNAEKTGPPVPSLPTPP